MNGPLGNSKFFSVESQRFLTTGPKWNIEILRKNSLFPSGPVIECQIYKYNSLDKVKKSPKTSRLLHVGFKRRGKKAMIMNRLFQQNGFTSGSTGYYQLLCLPYST